MSNSLNDEIDTLSQRIAMLTGALNPKDRQEVLFWFSVKADLVCDMIKINHELDKLLIGKLK